MIVTGRIYKNNWEIWSGREIKIVMVLQNVQLNKEMQINQINIKSERMPWITVIRVWSNA